MKGAGTKVYVAALACVVTLIIGVTLYPFDFQHVYRLGEVASQFESTDPDRVRILRPILEWLIPPLTIPESSLIGDYLTDLVEPVANVVLFIPLGFTLAPIIHRRVRRWIFIFLAVQATCTAASLSIETLQVFLPGRHPTLSDVVVNSLGGLCGFLAFRVWARWSSRYDAPFSVTTWIVAYASYALFAFVISLVAARGPYLGLHSWSDAFPLVIGNEASGERPWKGRISDLLITPQLLSADEAGALLRGGGAADVSEEFPLLVLFDDSLATTLTAAPHPSVRGCARDETDLNLIWNPRPPETPVKGGVQVGEDHWLISEAPVSCISRQIAEASRFTLRIAAMPARSVQKGPARLVSISKNPYHRNLTIGQEASDLIIRIRTRLSGPNGLRYQYVIPGLMEAGTHLDLLITYDQDALKVEVDGNVYMADLTPPARAFLYLSAFLLPNTHFDIHLRPSLRVWYSLMYYGLLFLPLGAFLGLLISRLRVTRRCKLVTATLGVLLPVLIVQVIFVTAGFEDHFVINAVFAVLFCAGCNLLTFGVQRISVYARVAGREG